MCPIPSGLDGVVLVMRTVVISERWESRTDEGMLGFLDHLVSHLKTEGPLLILHERGSVEGDPSVRRVPMGKGLVTAELKRVIRGFHPDLVLYCPTACATLNALVRHRRLERALRGIPCALISLQLRSYSGLAARIARWLRPWRLVVLSRRAENLYRQWGFPVLRVRAGVDLEVFHPVDEEARQTLRQHLGWGDGERVVLHVGHLRPNRGLERLMNLAGIPGMRVVMAASTATRADSGVKRRLQRKGVEVRHEYLPRIQELYQASDLYLFPVGDDSGSIEFPLSVLEAMACNLRVLTTSFGALPDHFPEGGGFRYLEAGEELAEVVEALLREEPVTRHLVSSFGWESSIASFMRDLREAMSS